MLGFFWIRFRLEHLRMYLRNPYSVKKHEKEEISYYNCLHRLSSHRKSAEGRLPDLKPVVRNFSNPLREVWIITQTLLTTLQKTPEALFVSWPPLWWHWGQSSRVDSCKQIIDGWRKTQSYLCASMGKFPQTPVKLQYTAKYRDVSGSDGLNQHRMYLFGKGLNMMDIHLDVKVPHSSFKGASGKNNVFSEL